MPTPIFSTPAPAFARPVGLGTLARSVAGRILGAWRRCCEERRASNAYRRDLRTFASLSERELQDIAAPGHVRVGARAPRGLSSIPS